MPAGRPTSYKPEYCELIVKKMGEGYSVMAFAGLIGVSRETVYNWAKEHPEFFNALKAAQAACAARWEKILLQIGETGQGSAAAAIFALKNRARDEWREKVEHDMTSSDGTMSPPKDWSIKVVAVSDDDEDFVET